MIWDVTDDVTATAHDVGSDEGDAGVAFHSHQRFGIPSLRALPTAKHVRNARHPQAVAAFSALETAKE